MPGKTPYEAVSNFLSPLQRAASCITRTPFVVSHGGRDQMGKVHTLTWAGFKPIKIRVESRDMMLDLAIQYEIVRIDDPERGPYKVATRGYMHALNTCDDAESFAFHWHPTGNSSVIEPHLHVGNSELNTEGVLTKKVHVPSPRMSVEHTLRFCIQELGAKPLRPDWATVLHDTEDLFKLWRTWP